MSGFDLLSLAATHFEKVINKLQDKSYFRLQQTSKIMNEAIQSKNICIHLEEFFYLEQVYIKNEKERMRWHNAKDVECFYGIRFDEFDPGLQFRNTTPELFKKNCDVLRKYRITCERLNFTWPSTCIPHEHMTALMDILQPRMVSVINHWSTASTRDPADDAKRCKVLFQTKSKPLEEVHVRLGLEHTATFLPKLLSKFSSIRIKSDILNPQEQFNLLRVILKILRFQSFPNLRKLWLYSNPVGRFVEIVFDKIKREFSYLDWVDERENEDEDEENETEDVGDDALERGIVDDDEDIENDSNDDETETDEEESDAGDESEVENDDEKVLEKLVTADFELPHGPICRIIWGSPTLLLVEIDDSEQADRGYSCVNFAAPSHLE